MDIGFHFFVAIIAFLSLALAVYRGVGNDPLDPGFIHLLIVAIANISMFTSFYFYFSDSLHYWSLWESTETVVAIFHLNFIYILSFIFSYIYFLKFQRKKFELTNLSTLITPNFHCTIFCVLVIWLVLILLEKIGLRYFAIYWENVLQLSSFVLVAIILLKIKSVKLSLFCIFSFFIFDLFVLQPTEIGNVVEINRGGAFQRLAFMSLFVVLVKGRHLANGLNVFLGVSIILIFSGISQFVEGLLSGSSFDFNQLIIYVLTGFELRMMENQSLILINVLNDFPVEIGRTYGIAIIDFFLPFLNTDISPSNAFAANLNQGTEIHSKYGLSFIAEGILNFGLVGPIFAGAIGAACILPLRWFLNGSNFFRICAAAYFYPLVYFVYRSDLSFILKKFQIGLLSFFIFFSLYVVISSITWYATTRDTR